MRQRKVLSKVVQLMNNSTFSHYIELSNLAPEKSLGTCPKQHSPLSALLPMLQPPPPTG